MTKQRKAKRQEGDHQPLGNLAETLLMKNLGHSYYPIHREENTIESQQKELIEYISKLVLQIYMLDKILIQYTNKICMLNVYFSCD